MTLTEQELSSIINDQLQQVLQELNQSLTQLVDSKYPPPASVDDRYLLAVNRFYYQSFSDHYFPVFRQHLQEDIAHLLGLAHDEAALKRDIMANIQRYARLYNQVKTIHKRLSATREESQLKILEVTRDHSQYLADLLYPLKTLLDRVSLFRSMLETIQEFMKDEELLRLARISPDHIIFLEQVIALDLNQPAVSQGLNHVLAHLHNSRNILRYLSEPPWNQEAARDTILNMVTATEKVLARQAPQSLRSFYEGQFKRQYLMYTSLMEAGIDRNNVKQVQEMARQFEAWMERLVIVLDRGVRFVSHHGTELLRSAHYMSGLPAIQVDRIHKEAQSILQDTKQLVDDLSSSYDADVSYFLERTGETVKESLARLEPYKESPALTLPPLALHFERVLLELHFLKAQTEMLTHKQFHSGQILEQYLQVYNMIQSYLEMLTNIKVDLERLLAPRNISRFWKNHRVRIERIYLEKGHPFPADYGHLLEEHKVDIRPGDHEYPMVLYEEGDLFIIRVDNHTEYEVPPLIIGRSD
jgi:hypothetical protein